MNALSLIGGNPAISLLITLVSLSSKKNKSTNAFTNMEAKAENKNNENKNNENKTPKSSSNNKSGLTKDETQEAKPDKAKKEKAIEATSMDKLNKNPNKGLIKKNKHTNSSIDTNKSADNYNDDDDDDDEDDDD